MKGETYEEFVEKFKPKKTTDDCYTPPEIYEVVKQWACNKFNIDQDKIRVHFGRELITKRQIIQKVIQS